MACTAADRLGNGRVDLGKRLSTKQLAHMQDQIALPAASIHYSRMKPWDTFRPFHCCNGLFAEHRIQIFKSHFSPFLSD